MVLYKNVDVCDLESIAKNGILSMDKCGNNNWKDGNRADNDTSVVYLFDPINKQNSFPQYGVALLEVDCDASENKITENDIHKNDYKEYITNKVSSNEIKRVIIPEIFKSYVTIPRGVEIKWCGLKAECYGKDELEECSKEILEQFAKTAPLMSSESFNFFRGTTENNAIIDLYNIEYVF